jgi:hypothetical protein
MPHSLPRRIEPVRLSTSSLFVLPSPVNGWVGIRDFTFEACSSFTHVAAYQIAARLKADICPEAPTQSVTRPSRSVATMLIDIYMDGSSPHWRSAPLRRTVNKVHHPQQKLLLLCSSITRGNRKSVNRRPGRRDRCKSAIRRPRRMAADADDVPFPSNLKRA